MTTEAHGIRLLVFDNNGTALDDLHFAYGSVEMIFSVLGLPVPTKEQYRNEIGADFMQFYWSHGVPRDITGEQLNVIRKLYYRGCQNSVRYRDDFEMLLHACVVVGMRVGMCSAEIPDVLRGCLDRAGLNVHFKSGMVRGGAWPSKTPFLMELAEWAGVPREQCAYVDDTDDGICAAQDAGYFTIGFAHPTGYNSASRIHAAKPSLVVYSFEELRGVLPNLVRG